MKHGDYQVVLMTTAKMEEAEKIAEMLVGEKLAACVNLVAQCRSVYSWKGEIVRDSEVLMLAKTRRSLFQNLEKRVRDVHSYEVPEIISIDIRDSSSPYLKFLEDALAT